MEKEQKENLLCIKITHENYDDGLIVQLQSSPNLGLGMIARARRELDHLEQSIFADLDKSKKHVTDSLINLEE